MVFEILTSDFYLEEKVTVNYSLSEFTYIIMNK